MYYVYLLRSRDWPLITYVGVTGNLCLRFNQHNNGFCDATRPHRPWKLQVYIAFVSRLQAKRFEKYLKHGSGYAFAKKHFWSYST